MEMLKLQVHIEVIWKWTLNKPCPLGSLCRLSQKLLGWPALPEASAAPTWEPPGCSGRSGSKPPLGWGLPSARVWP